MIWNFKPFLWWRQKFIQKTLPSRLDNEHPPIQMFNLEKSFILTYQTRVIVSEDMMCCLTLIQFHRG
jgi:hypothetical protein